MLDKLKVLEVWNANLKKSSSTYPLTRGRELIILWLQEIPLSEPANRSVRNVEPDVIYLTGSTVVIFRS